MERVTYTRSIPVRYQADVAVIGGGIAGVSAACSAARSGARAILVERFGVTGGNMTVGGVANFCGETAGQGEVFDEIIGDLEAFSAVAPYQPYGSGKGKGESRVVDHEILAVVFQEMLLRRGVKLLLHTGFVDVRESSGRLSECIVCGPSGPEAVRARCFIDSTGDGLVAHRAGFATAKGRTEDHLQLPMSLMYFVREMDEPATPQLPPGWFDPITDKEDLPMTSPNWPNGPGGRAIKIKIPMFDATDTERMTAAEIAARRRMLEVLYYFQAIEKKPWRFDHCSPLIGIREGYRITGDYILGVEDLRAGREFDDAIARGVFYLDGHKPDDDKRTYILPQEDLHVPPYQIPFRCLVARDGKNLLMAGRCMSADQLALSSARVTTTCSMMGQAAGIAAALVAQRETDVHAIDPIEVRHSVEERGAKLELG
jgi:FAD-dependent oxidoreductase family protein